MRVLINLFKSIIFKFILLFLTYKVREMHNENIKYTHNAADD